jgi:hypothetical protein
LCATLVFSFAVSALPPEGDGFTSIRITPKNYSTNALVVINPSTGSSVYTMTKAGAVTYGGAQTFNSTTTWGTAGSIDFNGTSIDLDPTTDVTCDMDAGKNITFTVSDTEADAFLIQEGSSAYLDITTTNSSEAINLGNATTNPDVNILGSGTVAIAGPVDGAGAADFAGDFSVATSNFTVASATGNTLVAGTLTSTGALDVNAAADISGALVLSATTGDALSVASGAAIDNDGTLDQNGNVDMAGNVVLSGSSKTISAASLVDMNAGADVGGAALNLSFAGDALTMGAGNDASMDGYVAHGTGTPDKVVAGTDAVLYVTGASEFDGLSYFDADVAFAADILVAVDTNLQGELETNGVLKFDNIAAKTAAYAPAAATTDYILTVTAAAGSWTYAYPEEDCDAAADIGRIIKVKCAASGATGCAARPITITPETATIDGAASLVLSSDYAAVELLCSAVNTLLVF